MVVAALTAGALRVGAVIGRVAVGSARGLAAGARATASGARSGGRLVSSSTKVRTNIVKSTKKLKRIKLIRKRIKRSIFNELKRKDRVKRLKKGRGKSNLSMGILSSPLAAFGGVKKFIYTLLFGMAISNIETIKKVFDKVVEGFANFGKVMMTIINATSFITGLSFNKDGEEFDKQVKDVENAFKIPGFESVINNIGKKTKENRSKLPASKRDFDVLEESKAVNIDRSGIGGKYLSVEEEITQEHTKLQKWGEKNVPGISLNILPNGGYWKRIEFWQNLRNLKKQSEKEIRLKWEGGNPYLNNNVNSSKIETLNTDVSSENTVIINQPIIKKVYVPVGG